MGNFPASRRLWVQTQLPSPFPGDADSMLLRPGLAICFLTNSYLKSVENPCTGALREDVPRAAPSKSPQPALLPDCPAVLLEGCPEGPLWTLGVSSAGGHPTGGCRAFCMRSGRVRLEDSRVSAAWPAACASGWASSEVGALRALEQESHELTGWRGGGPRWPIVGAGRPVRRLLR